VKPSILYPGIGAVLIGALVFLLESCPVDRPLPQNLGGLTLRNQVGGDRASAILNRMHGKGVTPTENLIGLYSGPDGNATVYVSAYRSARLAYEAYHRMAGRIALGASAFTNLAEREVNSLTMSRCTGYGEVHYFFSFQTRLYWLGCEPRIAPRTIDAMISFLNKSPA
jgi:hypothetical protein